MTRGSDGTTLQPQDGSDRPAGPALPPALRHIERIWHISGEVPLPPGQTSAAAFEHLAPLFETPGTSHERTGDTLTFTKKDPAAQDKMAVFDHGVLQIESGAAGPVLRYHLVSRILLFCFLLPLLFLGFAQLAITFGKVPKPDAEAAAATGKDGKKTAGKAAAEKARTTDKKDKVLPINPIDKFLGAPAPKKKDKKDEKDKKGEKKPSPTPAYVFAGMFAALYVIGRLLEDWLIRKRFQKLLLGD